MPCSVTYVRQPKYVFCWGREKGRSKHPGASNAKDPVKFVAHRMFGIAVAKISVRTGCPHREWPNSDWTLRLCAPKPHVAQGRWNPPPHNARDRWLGLTRIALRNASFPSSGAGSVTGQRPPRGNDPGTFTGCPDLPRFRESDQRTGAIALMMPEMRFDVLGPPPTQGALHLPAFRFERKAPLDGWIH